ncbi:MAG: nucleotidyl transferase AbiEii/AbiGii toxin family protein [Desulfurellaceae bacterium]|nr:nucleotidyl transferase AbiEii/AbiGii toxin family protein [Desulfurellaceae bacterium]
MRDLKNLDCLLPKTKKLLVELIDSADFLHKYVMVGGSALAMHLCHRKSDDLDFFTYEDSFDKKEIFDYIRRFETKEIINESNEQIDLLINGVKVTFFNAKWGFLKPIKIERFNLATLEAIAAMKVNTLFLRAKYRDYYDLYCLAKEKMSVRQIFEYSKSVVKGINFKLFCMALTYVEDIEDDNIIHLEPRMKVGKKEIRDFFEKLIKQEEVGRKR